MAHRQAWYLFVVCMLLVASACVSDGVEEPAQPGVGSQVSATPSQVGVSASEEAAPARDGLEAGAAALPPPASAPERFVVHEWGTFTSAQASSGALMEGLHLTEEGLPGFVHVRSIGSPHTKSIDVLPEAVTQKMETPVIYFHGAVPEEVEVVVDFPQGVISEWFPASVDFAPAPGELGRIADGQMRWRVTPAPGADDASLPAVDPANIWAPSRRVPDAVPVRVGEELERFIFYRGLGRFETALQITHGVDDQLHLVNSSNEDIPAAFLLYVHEGGGGAVSLGSIPANSELVAAPGPKEVSPSEYVEQARAMVFDALLDGGLYEDEARAMVDTWTHSYFHSHGLRVLYVLPDAWTDALLPLHITPAPDELERVMIGRVEVLSRDEERALLDALLEPTDAAAELLAPYGRMALPRLHRALTLSDDPQVRARVEAMIVDLELAAMP